MERCPGDDDYFLPNAVESRTQHRFQMCRPPSALAPAQTFGGGHQYFEVLFSANRDVALYPSSAFFSMALSRQYMGVKAIRVASVSTAVPEVPSPQGISNFGTNQHGLCTQTTHFPVEAVPRTTWLPHHEGWIVDSGSFFPDIQNDQLCLESALQVNHSMADVPLAASLNRPLEPVPEFISPFEPAVRISTVVEDEQGRVYPYSSRPPPTYAAPPPQPAPVLQTPTPYEIQRIVKLDVATHGRSSGMHVVLHPILLGSNGESPRISARHDAAMDFKCRHYLHHRMARCCVLGRKNGVACSFKSH